VDGGILVKLTDQVLVATRRAVRGELGILKKTVEHMVAEVDERERKARSAMARLEADFMRRFVEFGKRG
jgi:F-type H+-transporting ATPase subunit epsilon